MATCGSTTSTRSATSTRGGRERRTRRRIIAAAAELFLDQGYGATTLDQVAGRAGVAVQTVYFHFGNKATLLKEALDVAAVGDDKPVALLDRPWLQEVTAEPDPVPRSARWPTCSPVATRSDGDSPSRTPPTWPS